MIQVPDNMGLSIVDMVFVFEEEAREKILFLENLYFSFPLFFAYR